jgi:hypothetical protein
MGPYHAIMVHFPVALWIVASAIVVFRALSESPLALAFDRVLMPFLVLGVVTGAIAYTHRWSLTPGPHGLVLGLGAAANSFRDKDRPSEDETGVSLRGQAEAYGPAPGGSYYALLQASTFRDAWLGLIQYSPSGLPVGIEMYRQYQQGYQATTTALRFATGADRWFIRAGVVRTSEEYRPFVGVTFNGF